MCPLRFILVLLGAIGLATFIGPMALGSVGGAESEERRRKRPWAKEIAVYAAGLALVALHADLLLSLGYTRCAFQLAADLHRHHWVLR
mmetsp:Transcript_148/g.276  ORF Transcript_148/g.276 Transcript_148/m.276 type:complete len:88 (-) Transcript_148:239-502(-)